MKTAWREVQALSIGFKLDGSHNIRHTDSMIMRNDKVYYSKPTYQLYCTAQAQNTNDN